MPGPGHALRDVLRVSNRILYKLGRLVPASDQKLVYSSTRRDIPLQVTASSEDPDDAQWIYMLSDPIPPMFDADGNVVPTKIKFVRFSIHSCDQGWVSQYFGMYQGCFSWFEASIIRPSSFSPQEQPLWLFDVLHKPISVDDTTLAQPPSSCSITELRSPYKDGNERWQVQANAQASRRTRRHDITWYKFSHHIQEEEDGYDKSTGSGRGLGFVDSLRAGDRIALVARARYSGWENNVQSAEIEIAYQI